ncbi:hypothetical protein [Enterobacter sp. CC120223-11]|uniref:hypothetical protein n=1 Tax=Enterobacter sp. CC120223-11 TaxID=1378073 RepID=UPI000BD0195C|nr:hypothetical protein [Enterobacter sp. CC120223-11]SNY59132.1 hypothetical protein SAMN02744775_00164 [Enterobacter sp. CC120223-11]
MNNYIIFIKDNETEVFLAERVTRALPRDLKRNGFTKYPYTIEANDHKEAIRKLNKQGSEHLEELSQFSGSIFFYCALLVVGIAAAFLFLDQNGSGSCSGRCQKS